jgi:hypothetical protein
MRRLKREEKQNNKIDKKDYIFYKLGTNKKQESICPDVLSLIRESFLLLSKLFILKEYNT